MPIYEYLCSGCGHEFEILQGLKESPLTFCPACQENRLQKKLSAAAFHLKGTGWYETDFKNAGKPEDKSKQQDKESKPKSDKSDSDTSRPSKSDSSKSESDHKSAAEGTAGSVAAS